MITKAPSEGVNDFHNNSDVDNGDLAQHHTLGFSHGQAAPGSRVYSQDDADGLFVPKTSFSGIAGGLTGNNAVGSGAWVGITLMAIQHIAGTGITNLANNYFRLNTAGWYKIYFQAGFQGGGAGSLRAVRIMLNGTTSISRMNGSPRGGFEGSAACEFSGNLSANDVINFEVYQDSGAGLNVVPLENQTKFSIERLRLP